MKFLDLLGCVLAALALTAIGTLIPETGDAWGFYSAWTFSWFSFALALVILVVAAGSVIWGQPPAELSRARLMPLYLTVVILLGAGVIYHGWGVWVTQHFKLSVLEWIGFSVLLWVFLFGPGRRPG